MPTTIPYDPSLVLGNIVHSEVLQNLIEISKVQAPIDAAQDSLSSLISVRRSLDMTVQELMNLNIPVDDILQELNVINKDIETAGKDYAKAWVDNVGKIKELKSKQLAIHEDYESPVDYNRTQIKNMPLSADSLKMEAQYFMFDENEETSKSTLSDIKGFVNNSTSELGMDFSSQATDAVSKQVNRQRQNHDISGTLVVSITCTHKAALLLAPFVLDVDKAIRVWNKIFTSDSDKIKTNSIASMQAIAQKSGTAEEKSYNILSGATYGSCFIGMVHVLNTTSTRSSQNMTSVAASLQEQFKVGAWFESESGGFGVNSSFSSDIKNLLSKQNITSHVSLVTMGSIPSIKSGLVTSAVKQFTNADPAQAMTQLATLANATSAEQATVDSSADASKTGNQLINMKTAEIKGVLAGLSDMDTTQNKMLDVGSMMDAMDDYIVKCNAGNIGVPINYYLKPITQSQLAEMWVAKYYPNKYLSISGDDASGPNASGGGTSGSATS